MPAKFLIVDERAKKQLLKLPLPIHKRIIRALNLIKTNPLLGIKLHGEFRDYYKFRVGDYRIIYRFDSKEGLVLVVKIEHRHGVYR